MTVKSLLAVLPAFIASSAMACPVFSGNYVCKSDQFNEPTSYYSVTEKTANGVTVYSIQYHDDSNPTVQSYDAITDGVTRPIVDPNTGATAQEKFSCSGDQSVIADSDEDVPQVGKFHSVMTITPTAQGATQSLDMTMDGQQPFHEVKTCSKQ